MAVFYFNIRKQNIIGKMAIYKNQILGNYSISVINYINSLDERNVPCFVTYLDENLITILIY